MVRIPSIIIPSVRVGSIGPTSNIGASGATPAPPTPITYLTQWKIVGNSEVHGQEIWSCGEYNPIDGKWHILVQPLGGNIADIALTEPLRKVNDVADTIEFPSETAGKALVTRYFDSTDMGKMSWRTTQIGTTGYYRIVSYDLLKPIKKPASSSNVTNVLTSIYITTSATNTYNKLVGIGINTNGDVLIYDPDYNQADSATAFNAHVDGVELIYELATPTTELIDAPQIEEADSYSMVISQGGKAVSWSSFETNSE